MNLLVFDSSRFNLAAFTVLQFFDLKPDTEAIAATCHGETMLWQILYWTEATKNVAHTTI